jgi:hypothetical protein
MLADSLVSFLPLGAQINFAGLVPGAVVQAPQTYDIAGYGVGQPVQSIVGLGSSPFGFDVGVDIRKTYIRASVGTGFTTGNGALLSVQFLGAPDTGAAGGFQPGVFQVFNSVDLIPAAALTAQENVDLDWPVAAPPGVPLPRFYRIQFTVSPGGVFTTGTIGFIRVTPGRPNLSAFKQAKSNF